MPNHITNIITSKRLSDIYKILKGHEADVDFNRLVPMPSDVVASYGTAGLHPKWYDWSIENWGTKWNAYEICATPDDIRFDTAWSCPVPIVQALADHYIPFRWEYADEDIGHNAGVWTYTGSGDPIYSEFGDPVEAALTIKGYDKEEYYREMEEWRAEATDSESSIEGF